MLSVSYDTVSAAEIQPFDVIETQMDPGLLLLVVERQATPWWRKKPRLRVFSVRLLSTGEDLEITIAADMMVRRYKGERS
jgi:hypothetical protein